MDDNVGMGYVDSGDIAFPVSFMSAEDPEYRVLARSARSLQGTVEFCDDWQDAYHARDAHGRVLRLRIEELTLLFAAVVPEGWTKEMLTLNVGRGDGDFVRVVELSDGVPHRELAVHEVPRGRWVAELLLPPSTAVAPSGVRPFAELVSFDRLWVRLALGRKARRSDARLLSRWVAGS